MSSNGLRVGPAKSRCNLPTTARLRISLSGSEKQPCNVPLNYRIGIVFCFSAFFRCFSIVAKQSLWHDSMSGDYYPSLLA